MAELRLRCTKCKGTNVQIAKWVNPNTDKQLDDFGSFADTKWCVDCKSHEMLEEISEESLEVVRDKDIWQHIESGRLLEVEDCEGNAIICVDYVTKERGYQILNMGDEFRLLYRYKDFVAEPIVQEITEAYLKGLRDKDTPLEKHPKVGWCGHISTLSATGTPCRSPMYHTYSGKTCTHGHQGKILEHLTCENRDCKSTDDVTYEADPYASNIRGDDTPVYQCIGCRAQSAADI